jgi:hypothetical protein
MGIFLVVFVGHLLFTPGASRSIQFPKDEVCHHGEQIFPSPDNKAELRSVLYRFQIVGGRRPLVSRFPIWVEEAERDYTPPTTQGSFSFFSHQDLWVRHECQ